MADTVGKLLPEADRYTLIEEGGRKAALLLWQGG